MVTAVATTTEDAPVTTKVGGVVDETATPYRIWRVQNATKMNSIITSVLAHLHGSASPTPVILHASSSTTHHSNTALPRLISVVEIVKRSYQLASFPAHPDSSLSSYAAIPFAAATAPVDAMNVDASVSGIDEASTSKAPANRSGKKRTKMDHRTNGLHQYTYLGSIEQPSPSIARLLSASAVSDVVDGASKGIGNGKGKGKGKEPEGAAESSAGLDRPADSDAGEGDEDEDEELDIEKEQERIAMQWLTSKSGRTKRPRMKHTPTMTIVLSLTRLVEFDSDRCFTYQPPTSTPISSSNAANRPTKAAPSRSSIPTVAPAPVFSAAANPVVDISDAAVPPTATAPIATSASSEMQLDTPLIIDPAAQSLAAVPIISRPAGDICEAAGEEEEGKRRKRRKRTPRKRKNTLPAIGTDMMGQSALACVDVVDDVAAHGSDVIH